MSQAEYQALNQKYGVEPQQAALRVRLEEIGAWAVPSTSKQMPLAHQPGQPTVGEQLREIGAWAVPSTSKTTVVASSSGEFDWNNAGIGAALVLGVAVFGAATLLAVRRHYHRPVAY
jgi:arginine repressor